MNKIILLLFVYSFSLNAQDAKEINRIFEPKYYDGKSLNTLKRDSQILDLVVGEKKTLMLKIKTELGVQEFFRLNDTTFVSRNYIDDKLMEKGSLVFNISGNITVDSFSTFDPETYAETLNIVSFHRLKKIGNWIENKESGEKWHGTYIDDRKDGFWTYYDSEGQFNSCKFKDDEIIGIYSPRKENIKKYVKWLFEKEFIWCKKDENAWELSLKPNENCSNLGKFKFHKNGNFYFEEVNTKITIGLQMSGLGKWKLNEISELELEFNDGNSLTLLITYLGKNHMWFNTK